MSSNYRSSSRGLPGQVGDRPAAGEDNLRSETLQIERKAFIFALKENPRGRFLRITEDVGGRRDSIIVPATGLEEFKRVINEMARISAETPAKAQQP